METTDAVVAIVLMVTLASVWVCVLAPNGEPEPMNPHAYRLGREVLVKRYSESEWEPCVVVAVSWKGALCLRRLSEIDNDGSHGNGFWLNKHLVEDRVRDVR